MDPDKLHTPILYQQVVESAAVPDAPGSTAELFSKFFAAAQAVVVDDNKVIGKKQKSPPPPPAPPPPSTFPAQQEEQIKKFLTPEAAAVYKAMVAKPEAPQDVKEQAEPPLPDPVPPTPPAPAPAPPVTWGEQPTPLAKVSQQLKALGFFSDLTSLMLLNGAPPDVALSLCLTILTNVQKVVNLTQNTALQQHAETQASYKAHTDKVIAQFQAEKAALQKALLILKTEAKAQEAELQQAQALKEQLDLATKEISTLKEQLVLASKEISTLVASSPVPSASPSSPLKAAEAFEAIGHALVGVAQARARYVEASIAEELEGQQQAGPWPSLPFEWDPFHEGCPNQCKQSKMVNVNQPAQGYGVQCSKCSKTWKLPASAVPSSFGKKAQFDREMAVKTLVAELGYDLDMALYLVDTAGAQCVLKYAQQVPAVAVSPPAYLDALQDWLELSKSAAPAVTLETLSKKAPPTLPSAPTPPPPPEESLVSKLPASLQPVGSSGVEVVSYKPELLPPFTADEVPVAATISPPAEPKKPDPDPDPLMSHLYNAVSLPMASLQQTNPKLAEVAEKFLASLQFLDDASDPVLTKATPQEYTPQEYAAESSEVDLSALSLIPVVSKNVGGKKKKG